MLLIFDLEPIVPAWYNEQFRPIRQAALLGLIQKVRRYELAPSTGMLVEFYPLFSRPM